jgi:hypothetical protein
MFYTIKTAALELGLSEQYVRHAIRAGKLVTSLEPTGPESNVNRHVISKEALETWRAATSEHSRREDGRSRYILYVTPDELEKIQKRYPNVPIMKPTYGKKEATDIGSDDPIEPTEIMDLEPSY